MNIVILDHHEQDGENSYATIVNPQINDYPNKFLSGAGVVFKTCEAIDEVMETDYAKNYLDICAVGLIGDMMDCTNLETRYLIQHGLYKMGNKDRCDPNLKLILKQLKKDFRPNSTDIAFYIVPFINSIIRLNKIENIIAIFLLEDEKQIKTLIKESVKLNDKRKEIQAKIVSELDETIDNSHKIIIEILESEENTQTLNGLIANNIMNKYNKPTFILSKDKKTNTYKGSARNCCGIDIREIINEKKLGLGEGHKGSFGVEIKEENLKQLIELFDNLIKDEDLVTEKLVDLELTENEITWEQLDELMKLNFVVGQGFKEPQFLIKGMFKTDYKIMKDIHVKLSTQDFDCVKFNLSEDEVNNLINAFCFDVIGGLSINSWYNFKTKQTTKTKQIMISDINVY
jgi:single-stranded-DNA-specific exonuclease